jgi:hypothetical protein
LVPAQRVERCSRRFQRSVSPKHPMSTRAGSRKCSLEHFAISFSWPLILTILH